MTDITSGSGQGPPVAAAAAIRGRVEPPGFQRITCPSCSVGLLGYEHGDRVVTGWCSVCGHRKPRARTQSTPAVEWNGSFDDIHRIPSAWYVPILTGEEVGRGGMVRCVFHDDEHPSMHVQDEDGGWCCHAGCGKGGLPEFYCRLQNRSLPTNPNEFKRLACEITDALRRSP